MRRFISLLLVTVMVAATAAGAAVNVAAKFAPGDCNGDGFYNNKDVVVLFRYVSGSTNDVIVENCDFNRDGDINNKDVVSLFRALSTESLPERVEDNGEDAPSGEETGEDTTEPWDTEPWDTDPWDPDTEEPDTEPWDTDTEEPDTEPWDTDPWDTEPWGSEEPAESVDVDEIEEIGLDEVKKAVIGQTNNYAYYKFTPEEDGWYAFYSISDSDTYGYIYNLSMRVLTSNDDYNGSNFRAEYYMTAGTAYILGARYYNIGNTGWFNVSVEKMPALTGIRFENSNITGYVNEGYDLYICPEPGNAVREKVITCTVSDESVAVITGWNNYWCGIHLLSEGTVTVTVTTESGLTATCEVTVLPRPAITNLWIPSQAQCYVGESTRISRDYRPYDASDSEIVWTSSDESVMTVSENGTVYCITEGMATITATTANGLTATCEVTSVIRPTLTGIRFEQDQINGYIEERHCICIEYEPNDAAYEEITWSSSDESVVVIGERYGRECIIGLMSEGTATITATTASGFTATCEINVIPRPTLSSIYFNTDHINGSLDETYSLYVYPEPDNAVFENVTWSSSDESVAVITGYNTDWGNFRLMSAGTATITATTESGLTATCEVTVAEPTFIYEDVPARVEINNGETKYVYFTAEEDGNYIFFASDYSNRNRAYLEIYSSNNWMNGCYERVSASLTAGVRYKIRINYYDCYDSESGYFNVTVKKAVPASELTLVSDPEIEMFVNSNRSIYFRFEPWDAFEEIINWTSSDESVVRINYTGHGITNGECDPYIYCSVRAVSAGTATLTATTASGLTATCEVTVNERPALTAIYLNEEQISNYSDNGYGLYVSYEPYEAVHENVTWTSSDESIVSIVGCDSDWCDITLVSEGTATITATTESGLTATCEITVLPRPAITYLWVTEQVKGYVGESTWISRKYRPYDASEREIVWTSSDESVATVSENGTVYCITEGTATITATAKNGITATCEVTSVIRPTLTGIRFEQDQINGYIEERHCICIEYEPYDAAYEEITWSSSDESVVVIEERYDRECIICLMSEGTATITATTESGLVATCEINAIPRPALSEIRFTRDQISGYAGENSYYLYIEREPNDAAYEQITWSSSDECVVIEDWSSSWCYVRLVSEGTATITATAESGLTATCEVISAVRPALTAIYLNEEQISNYSDKGYELYVSYEPYEAVHENVTWTSSDESIVSIVGCDSDWCDITLVSEGIATITATTESGLTATCEVTVMARPAITSLWISEKITGYVGESGGIGYEYRPYNASSREIVWTSSDESVVTVSEYGNFYCVSEGTATITATAKNGITATCEVTSVIRPTLTGIRFKQDQLNGYAQDRHQLYIEREPYDAVYEEITWTSSNESIVGINGWGSDFCDIYLISEGTVTITATTESGLTATCTVTVGVPVEMEEETPYPVEIVNNVKQKFTFTPGETGEYIFLTDNYSDPDSFGVRLNVYDQYNSRIVNLYGSKNLIWLEGGQTYRIEAYFYWYDTEPANGTFDLRVAKTIQPTGIEFSDGSETEMHEYENKTLSISFTPWNSLIGDHYIDQITSSDDSVVEVNDSYWDSNGTMYVGISAVSLGTAVLTATSENGLTASITVNVTPRPAATAISLNPGSIAGYSGSSYYIRINYEPSDAQKEEMTWTSSDESVARIAYRNSSMNTVYLISEGTATITATNENGLTATCEVTVLPRPELAYIDFEMHALTGYTGESYDNYLYYEPGEALIGNITWTSSDESIVAVEYTENSWGVVRLVSEGTATVTATSENGLTASFEVNVIPRPAATAVRFSREYVSGVTGEYFYLDFNYEPYNAMREKITWTISDESVVTFDEEDEYKFYMVSKGTATITITTENGLTATCTVVVKDISDFESISLGEVKEAVIEHPGECEYFTFTPEEDGEYIFYSASYDDTFGFIYDSNMNEIDENDDYYDCNFFIDCYLTAGETYILGLRYCSSTQTGTYVFTIATPEMPMMEIPAEEEPEEPSNPATG